MRCQRFIALALLASFVLAVAAPVSAWDGGGPGDILYIKDHPWQDDNQNGGEVIGEKIIRIVFGPIVIQIKVPVSTANIVKKTDNKRVTTAQPRPKQTQTKRGQ